MKFRDPTPAESVKQLETKLKSLAWNDWQVPTAGQFEVYCELWKEYLTAKSRVKPQQLQHRKIQRGAGSATEGRDSIPCHGRHQGSREAPTEVT